MDTLTTKAADTLRDMLTLFFLVHKTKVVLLSVNEEAQVYSFRVTKNHKPTTIDLFLIRECALDPKTGEPAIPLSLSEDSPVFQDGPDCRMWKFLDLENLWPLPATALRIALEENREKWAKKYGVSDDNYLWVPWTPLRTAAMEVAFKATLH